MAVGDLTVTYNRQKVIDFTIPWMNFGKRKYCNCQAITSDKNEYIINVILLMKNTVLIYEA